MDYNSGKYKQQYKYKSFMPTLINKSFTWSDMKINTLLENARGALGELNAYSELIPNIEFFINMHISKEATDSNRIEGTKTEMDEVVKPESEISPEKKDDWCEIKNYIASMRFAIDELEKLPISMRLICLIHEKLLDGVRGQHKQPGEIRNSQNWIGGSNLNDAFYIPPHQNDLKELLSDFDKFLNNDNLEIPELIKIAIIHYQFETIHPFCDGNGRIGRLLITLYLIKNGVLTQPTLYISSFFAKNKGAYYDALTMVREGHNMEHWIKFFLNGVYETAKSSIQTFKEIIKIRTKYENKILKLGAKAKLGQTLLNILYSTVTINVNEIAEKLNINYKRAKRLLDDFIELGILHEMGTNQRNKRYYFKEYLVLFLD